MNKAKALHWLQLLYKSEEPNIKAQAYYRLRELLELLLPEDKNKE